jgi:predicted aldo/keto reductase-like oxidoreductase
MIYKQYGTTGVTVSALGFGGMRFADQNDVDGCAGLVKAAYDAGITYFDTAIGYGKSEELFGVAFKEMQKTRAKKPFYVSTKTFAGDESSLRKEIETSLTRMGLDSIDFYHVWCVLTPDAWKARLPVVKAFEKLRNEGLVKHVCVSTHMTGREIETMLSDYDFAGVLLGYSAMNFAYRDAGIEAAAKKNMGVVVMNPLGGGLIPQHPGRFAFVKSREDETVVEGALRFLFNDPRITVTLVGLSNTAQLQEAIRAVDGFQALSESQVKRIHDGVKAAFNELCTGCRYCDDCPEGIPVPKFMDAYNQYMLSGKMVDIFNRLNWHWGLKADSEFVTKCVECGACESACTQHLPIIERLKQIRAEAEVYLKSQKA